MRYAYNSKSLPALPTDKLVRLDQAAHRLAEKLEALDLQRLPVSEHFRVSVKNFRTFMSERMMKYVHLMSWSLHPEFPSKNTAFVDYGGGTGFMACLAKEAGIATVVYNDIFDQWCKDAHVLAKALGCPADAYVCGNIQEVVKAAKCERDAGCSLVSINVIEHIYDIDEFLRSAATLVRGPMNLVLSTSANPFNPFVSRRHHRQHRLWEYEDGPHEGAGPQDTPKAFHNVRKDIVQQVATSLSEAEMESLARATRGLRRDDIEKCVAHYRTTGNISVKPGHPTNTCDPLTGNWQERLLDVPAIVGVLNSMEFRVNILGGYYDGNGRTLLKRTAKKGMALTLNHAINLLGRSGVRIAPSFAFHASRGTSLVTP